MGIVRYSLGTSGIFETAIALAGMMAGGITGYALGNEYIETASNGYACGQHLSMLEKTVAENPNLILAFMTIISASIPVSIGRTIGRTLDYFKREYDKSVRRF